jgi:hypothetical protein
VSTSWVDEVPPIGGPLDPQAVYVERLRPLLAEPGRWAIIKSGTAASCHGAAQALRLRQYHVPLGQWEFTVRTFRRGVHIGRGGTANLYARYLGPDEDYAPLSGYVARDALFDEQGRRICPSCEELLRRPKKHGGPYPKMCDECWSKVDTKWGRKKAKRSS